VVKIVVLKIVVKDMIVVLPELQLKNVNMKTKAMVDHPHPKEAANKAASRSFVLFNNLILVCLLFDKNFLQCS
jgi:hypothetical protein